MGRQVGHSAPPATYTSLGCIKPIGRTILKVTFKTEGISQLLALGGVVLADTIYKQLAVALDNLPNGFPSTDCGVEIEILKMMFSPEEALVAANMSEVYEAVTAIAECCGRTVADVKLWAGADRFHRAVTSC